MHSSNKNDRVKKRLIWVVQNTLNSTVTLWPTIYWREEWLLVDIGNYLRKWLSDLHWEHTIFPRSSTLGLLQLAVAGWIFPRPRRYIVEWGIILKLSWSQTVWSIMRAHAMPWFNNIFSQSLAVPPLVGIFCADVMFWMLQCIESTPISFSAKGDKIPFNHYGVVRSWVDYYM